MQTACKMNAVLLAGDRRASIQLHNDNKAFLELNGVPLFIHVARALRAATLVDKVIVVGPSDRIRDELKLHHAEEGMLVVEQRENMIENFKAGYVVALGFDDSTEFWSLKGTKHENTPVLVAPCDIPLLVPEEVDEFLMRSNVYEYDYSIGITSRDVLSHYHPMNGKTGIQMIYFHVKEDLMRHNNLHIGKPLLFEHLDYIEKMYEWRYQTRLANMLRMFFSLLTNGWRLMKSLRMFILMQLSLYYDRHGHPSLSDRIRSKAGFFRLVEGIGNAIGARVQIVYTHFGGAALDADNETDLDVIAEHYDEWMNHQRNLHP
ncbi:MAG: nucleotidyltransferase family protein [Kiritimatiellaceae bacterium]|nr:nucleotidyltransferase family protein [Kiritimatiellaceae bacterium]